MLFKLIQVLIIVFGKDKKQPHTLNGRGYIRELFEYQYQVICNSHRVVYPVANVGSAR